MLFSFLAKHSARYISLYLYSYVEIDLLWLIYTFLCHNTVNYCFCLIQVRKVDETTKQTKTNKQSPLSDTTQSRKVLSFQQCNLSEYISVLKDCLILPALVILTFMII